MSYCRCSHHWGMHSFYETNLSYACLSDGCDCIAFEKRERATMVTLPVTAEEWRAFLAQHGASFTDDQRKMLEAAVEALEASEAEQIRVGGS